MSNAQELPDAGNSSPPSKQCVEDGSYPCPFSGVHCQWKGALKTDVMDHLKKHHKSMDTFQGEQILFVAHNTDFPGRVGWAMNQKCFNADFIFFLMKREDPHFYGFVQLIGSKKEAQEFAYKLELSAKNGTATKSWEATPRSLQEGNSFAPDCLTLNEEDAMTFAVDAKLGIEVTITRKILNDTIKQLETLNLNEVETKKSEATEQVEAENLLLKSKLEEAKKLIDELNMRVDIKEAEYNKIEGQNKKFFARIQSLEKQVQLDSGLINKLKKDVEKAEVKLSDSNYDSEEKISILTLRLQDAETILNNMRKKVSTDYDNKALKKENMNLITANEELKSSNRLLNVSMEELKDSLYSSRTFYDMVVEQSQQKIQTLEMHLDNAKSQIRRMTENENVGAKCNEELKEEIKALNQKIGDMEQAHKSADEMARTQQQTLTVAIKYLTDQLNEKSINLKRVESAREEHHRRNLELYEVLEELEVRKRTEHKELTNEIECQELAGVLLRNQIVCLKKDLEKSKAAAENDMEEMRKKLSAQSELLSEIQLKTEKEKEEKEELLEDGYEVFEF
ncbi:hypothetical protein CAEBREN_21558 [Caenorhabditis brenneri]|uniref:E3 ubiquitin-protein ligase n=1 Tax=Caenorhabditis brenneri TaxID=135651 RepID=G0NM27_CAEBE|nr:hypothetical protein CAEBREN_21558 [Caenorhabditis brenneri]